MAFNQQYNTDDILVRSVIVGLLDLLNKRFQIRQVMDTESEIIPVPFFYQRFGSERFMQDFFMKYHEGCEGPITTEGGSEPVPRGIIALTSLAVNQTALTSKFVRGTYNKEINGEIKAFSSMLNVIPLNMVFDASVLCNTLVESLKITQAAIGSFYKAAKFNVNYSGFMVPCQAGFSQDYQIEKQIQYTYGDGEDKITMKFSIEVETYLPVPDDTSERWRGNIMDNGIGNEVTEHADGSLTAAVDVQVQGEDPRFPKE